MLVLQSVVRDCAHVIKGVFVSGNRNVSGLRTNLALHSLNVRGALSLLPCYFRFRSLVCFEVRRGGTSDIVIENVAVVPVCQVIRHASELL